MHWMCRSKQEKQMCKARMSASWLHVISKHLKVQYLDIQFKTKIIKSDMYWVVQKSWKSLKSF